MSSSTETSAILRPLGSSRSRTAEVVFRLANQIGNGRIASGARLPAGQAMTVAFDVSGTVVREPVAAPGSAMRHGYRRRPRLAPNSPS